MTTAFVFGGGGRWGAVEVGMLLALTESGVRPDLIVGSSIGALNGAATAADPTHAGARRLQRAWSELQDSDLFDSSLVGRLRTVGRQRIALHRTSELRHVVEGFLDVARFDDLAVPFQCVAASIERAAEHWFDRGPLVDAILASAAVPGLFPPVRIGDESYYDGGLVNSVPVDRAVELGASRVFVLQVGRLEQPLEPPHRPHEPALVAFEIARRHRFTRVIESLPEEVELHLLPSANQLRFTDRRQIRWRDMGETDTLIENAREASLEYLSGKVL